MKDCKRSSFLPIGLASHSPHYLAAAPQPCQESMGGCVVVHFRSPPASRLGRLHLGGTGKLPCLYSHRSGGSHSQQLKKKQTHKRYTSTLIRLSAPGAAPLESTLELRACIYSLSRQSKVGVECPSVWSIVNKKKGADGEHPY